MKHLSFVNVKFGRVWGGKFLCGGGQNVLSSFPLGLSRIAKANDSR